MSSINGIGQSLYQFGQNLSITSPSQTSAVTSSTDATDTGTAGSTTSSSVQGHGQHHRGHGGGFKKIEQAVTDALQSAATGAATAGSASADPNQTIQDAIAKVFQNNNASQAGSNSTTSSDPDGDGDAGAAGATSDTDTQQAFLKTLQSFGVDPEQFHQDFLTAVKDAQGGQVDPTTAFKSFPPGTFVDTTG